MTALTHGSPIVDPLPPLLAGWFKKVAPFGETNL